MQGLNQKQLQFMSAVKQQTPQLLWDVHESNKSLLNDKYVRFIYIEEL